MNRILHHRIVKRTHAIPGIALALSIGAGSGLVRAASAQTIGSVYTSTAARAGRSSSRSGADYGTGT